MTRHRSDTNTLSLAAHAASHTPSPFVALQTAGVRGPILLEDYHLLEKLAQFDRERIPERVVHARGAVAKGFFEVSSCFTSFSPFPFPLPFPLLLFSPTATNSCYITLLPHLTKQFHSSLHPPSLPLSSSSCPLEYQLLLLTHMHIRLTDLFCDSLISCLATGDS